MRYLMKQLWLLLSLVSVLICTLYFSVTKSSDDDFDASMLSHLDKKSEQKKEKRERLLSSPNFNCIDSPEGWYDSDGPIFTCQWYAQGKRLISLVY